MHIEADMLHLTHVIEPGGQAESTLHSILCSLRKEMFALVESDNRPINKVKTWLNRKADQLKCSRLHLIEQQIHLCIPLQDLVDADDGYKVIIKPQPFTIWLFDICCVVT